MIIKTRARANALSIARTWHVCSNEIMGNWEVMPPLIILVCNDLALLPGSYVAQTKWLLCCPHCVFLCCPDQETPMLPTCIVFFLCWPGSVTSMLPTLWFRSYVAHVVFFLKLPGFVLLLMLPRSIIKRFHWCLDWLAELAVVWKLLKPCTHTH